MSVDFSALLNQDVSEIKEPAPTPPGTYAMLVGEEAETGHSGQKGTPFIKFKCSLLSPGADVEFPEGSTFEDIEGRKMTLTFWLTENSTFRLVAFITACGIDTSGGGSLSEYIPQLAGSMFTGTVAQKPRQDDPTRMYSEITDYAPAE